MISKLEIENYRSIQHLDLEGLKRVNLITGKNNCGKSTLLEAVSIIAAKGRLDGLRQILNTRKEISIRKSEFYRDEPINAYRNIEDALEDYRLLFYGRNINFSSASEIKISTEQESVRLSFVKFIFNKDKNSKEETPNADEFDLGYKITYQKGKLLRSIILSEDVVLQRRRNDYPEWLGAESNFQFINAATSNDDFTREQFSKIALTEKEDILINMLSNVEPGIQRVGFSGDENDNRVLLRIKGTSTPIPLSSMGYGMKRAMSIILGLVNSENGYLLIDEFENGLHWTIQKHLWDTIFKVAEKLKVQVFATTHSEDAIRAFAEAAEDIKHDSAAFVRLNKDEKGVAAIKYETSELVFATENDIETRGL